LHLGLRAPYDINTRTIGKADLALTIRTTNTSNVEDRPPFEITALIRQMGQSFTFSYFQHFVVRRRIYNPFEEKHVKQIVNYIDVGTIVDVQDDGHTNLSIAASWQLNKNHMIKAKVDNRRASLAYVFKSWFHPALSLSIAGKYDYATMRPSLGFILNLQSTFQLYQPPWCFTLTVFFFLLNQPHPQPTLRGPVMTLPKKLLYIKQKRHQLIVDMKLSPKTNLFSLSNLSSRSNEAIVNSDVNFSISTFLFINQSITHFFNE